MNKGKGGGNKYNVVNRKKQKKNHETSNTHRWQMHQNKKDYCLHVSRCNDAEEDSERVRGWCELTGNWEVRRKGQEAEEEAKRKQKQ